MSTLQEIADGLDVSVATVSRALNDKPGVSPTMRQKVLQLAQELQYHPNLAARNLSTSRTNTVLFIVHHRRAGCPPGLAGETRRCPRSCRSRHHPWIYSRNSKLGAAGIVG